MASAAPATRTPTDWKSGAMQARIRRRYRSERIFRLFGLGALSLAAAFLLFLLYTVVAQGWTGFQSTQVRLTVDFVPRALGVTADELRSDRKQAALQRVDFQGLTLAAAERSLGADAEGVVSEGAWLGLRDALADNPDLLGKRADLWVPATSAVDLLAKGHVDRAAPAEARPVSDRIIERYDRLEDRGLIRTGFNYSFLSNADSTDPELAGIWGAAMGSLLTLVVTFLISFPIGVLTAIYLEEYAPKNRFTDVIEVSINNLAAVPSIIFGLLGLAVFLNFFDMPRSAPLVGGLTLALMTLPVIVITGRVAIKSVPPSIRDAALGVGASPVQVVFHHVLPLAMPGIMTGAIIGMARALGETAPLLMIGMRAFVADAPEGMTEPATVLPVQIFLWSDEVSRAFVEKTSAAIMVLLVFLLLMNGLAVYLRNKFERRW